jgi:acetylornithine deacetylase/succinyl-diaminopimelate desuccinylase-like protein
MKIVKPFLRNIMLYMVAAVLLSSIATAQVNSEIDTDRIQIRAIESMGDFRTFLAIPNDALKLDDIQKNLAWCDVNLASRGFNMKVWKTETRPILFAQKIGQAGLPTVLFYFHIDGQSVDPQFWYQDNPYEAVLKKSVEGEGWVDMDWSELSIDNYNPDWYMFARSASDSKNNLMMFITALDILHEEGKELPYNLKLVLDFEEEKSSPSLAGAVIQHKDTLSADMLVIYDGPRHISNEPTLAFGARGIAGVTMTVYGPVFPQHSGHYGNYAPNPALRLSQLLASMKDEDGRVLIEGFYDGITFDEKTLAVLNAVPDNEAVIQAKLGFKGADKVADTYQKALQYPSLNIKGMLSGWVGAETRTIVPAKATVEMDIRLVVESDPERLLQLLREHIENEGYHIIDHKPTQRERLTYPKICRMSSSVSYQAFRTEFDTPIGNWLTKAMRNAFNKEPVRTRTMGGSIPIAPFIQTLDVPAVVVPTANRDNNQHSPNENIRLGNYVEGVQALYSILSTPID